MSNIYPRDHLCLPEIFDVLCDSFRVIVLDGKIEEKVVEKAIVDLGINSEKPNPVTS